MHFLTSPSLTLLFNTADLLLTTAATGPSPLAPPALCASFWLCWLSTHCYVGSSCLHVSKKHHIIRSVLSFIKVTMFCPLTIIWVPSASKAQHHYLPFNQLDEVSKLIETYQNDGLLVRTLLPNPKIGGYCSCEPLTSSDHDQWTSCSCWSLP